jgi:cytochrome c
LWPLWEGKVKVVDAALRRSCNGSPGFQPKRRRHPDLLRFVGSLVLLALSCSFAVASTVCTSERAKPLRPTDRTLCTEFEKSVRKPRALSLDAYQAKLEQFLRNFCHRDEASGWKRDKHVRDTGPYIGTLKDGKWTGTYFGTHAPVVTWYSPDMHEWLKSNRAEESAVPLETPPVPDGAIMVKEMFPPPAAACAAVDPIHLAPTSGAAVMVRDAGGSYDGWFWGWFGWGENDWRPDWPAPANNDYLFMGYGLYCTNCHASARDNSTFASLRNIKGERGDPLVFLSQTFVTSPLFESFHEAITKGKADGEAPTEPPYPSWFTRYFQLLSKTRPSSETVVKMPSETYDHVWAPAGKPDAKSQLLTSTQCLGCHSAGGTGLQFDMTEPGPDNKMVNLSPYGTWRTSPKGLAGRDPIFFAQLASETETFHPESAREIEDTCLGCHAVQGQRQFAADRHAATGTCEPYARDNLKTIPFQADGEVRALAHYAALARDGVSCTTCHSMVLGKPATAAAQPQPQNACIDTRQERTNPGLTGLARTFTGNFLLGPPGKIYGPFREPKQKAMENATGMVPEHSEHVRSSEMCASCHTVHLPVLHRGKKIASTYEQATYPEWAFSAYRTGSTPDGPLPLGAGANAQSCQECHMPSRDAAGIPYRSKIATIQEYSNFPQAEHTLPAQDIDLPVREGFARHTLVGLNLFLIKMAQQFPQLLGIRTEDPMLTAKRGVEPLVTTENAIVDQARNRTADVTVSEVRRDRNALSAKVTVTNKAGHKFPSGVAFRRAFIEFSVLDARERVLWSSGRTNSSGVIVDERGTPIAGELRWRTDCSARINPAARAHQPHFQVITRQDQAQIYEELVSKPANVSAPVCGIGAKPEGELTTSFLSICAKVKDNRLLPSGFLALDERISIADALGANHELAEEVAPVAVGGDPDYQAGGADTVTYRIPLAQLRGRAAAVRATLYYQATPPYYLQDRFCTSRSEDTARLYYLTGRLDVASTPIKDWKLQVGTSARVAVP